MFNKDILQNPSNDILFSIGIPAFKGKFLAECIRSILDQTYTRFELIIVNDCSPDKVEEIVHSFQDQRIRYFKNERNTGAEHVVENWNKCLAHANGDYFILMGDDDKLESDYLQEFIQLISKYPALDIYHCRSRLIDELSQPISITPSLPEFESIYDNIWHRISFHRTQFISDFVYRVDTLKKNGGFYNLPLAWASDDISSYIACGSKGIAHSNKAVFNYRVNRFNISKTGNVHLKMKAILLEEQWLKSFLFIEPVNEHDKIIYHDILKKLKPYIQKKKLFTMHVSLKANYFKPVFKWYFKRNNYSLSNKEFLYAIIGKF